MPKTKHAASRAIGSTLRTWREERGLSLRAVQLAARAFPEPIGFDYLSRLERGELMPSVPKLTTLAAVYGRPVSELVDLYEIEQFRSLIPKRRSYELLRKLGIASLGKGELTNALACFLGALDAAKRDGPDGQRLAQAHNNVGGTLIRCERYFMARQYLEEGIGYVATTQTRVHLLDNLAVVYYHLDKLALAELLSREAYALGAGHETLKPILRGTRAAILLDLKRHPEAEELLREAVDEYKKSGNETEEIRDLYNLGHCLVEQGKVEDGLVHLRTAAARAAELANPELRAKSLFFFGRCLHKIGRKDEAMGPLLSALQIAQKHNMRNEGFHSAYYLWLLAQDGRNTSEQARYLEVAGQNRVWIQQKSEETVAFDVVLKETVQANRPAFR